jgi:diacylglycerol kinase family enzyme
VLDVMVHNGVKLEIAETLHAGHATLLAREAALRGTRLVVAAGGDGTIAEVAAGLAGTTTPLGIIPLGTANVLAHELGLPFAPRDVASALAFGRTRPLWPGMVQAGSAERLFVQMIGAGFDAEVVHRLDPFLKRLLGRGAYVLQGLREAMRYGFPPIRLGVDGAEMEAHGVIVTKGRFYAGRYTVAADATPLQPGFTVVLLTQPGPLVALTHALALPFHQLNRMRGVTTLRGSEIRLTPNRTQADGDPAPCGPLVIRDAATPIRVVVA